MNIKEILIKKKITMYRLAKATGLGQSTICEIVNGKRKHIKLETAMKISSELGIGIEAFYEYIGGNSNAS